ncbi:MAG: sigma-70 family RNA polymerase sigma factor [Atopobiaceae bacterium]|nr:sigma-70 family RNA polymerase sigma factor [Atopobiaceae bacterium]
MTGCGKPPCFGESWTGRGGRTAIRRNRLSERDLEKREFTRLYQESYSVVYNYVRYRMASDEAEDIVSEAFMLAARSFRSFDPSRAKFSTWVIKIAINCMNTYYRREHPTVDVDDIAPILVSEGSEEDAVDDRELVDRLLGVLDDDERELVILKYREDMRNVDIAEQLGMNASTVSTLLSRAVAKMRAAANGLL